MSKKSNRIYLYIFLVFALVVSFSKIVTADMSTNYKVIQINEFACDGLPGVTFKYPVFKDWEIKSVNVVGNRCVMYFNWPPIVEYEVAPMIIVEKRSDVKNTGIKTLKTPSGILYERQYDPKQYVKNHKPEKGDWDWLVFYGPKFNVRISRNMFGAVDNNEQQVSRKYYKFDETLFYGEIIKSFKFSK